jgi:hypothetical protein
VTDDELLALSWSLNEARRHLTTSQRACAAAEVAEKMPESRGRKAKGNTRKTATISTVIETFGAKERTVQLARELLRESPDLFAQVKRGDLTVGAAHEAFQRDEGTSRWGERICASNTCHPAVMRLMSHQPFGYRETI